MRFTVVLLTLLFALFASAQTKPELQNQLLNMAKQSNEIQAIPDSTTPAVLESMAAGISQLHTQTLTEIVQLQGWPTKEQVTEQGVKAAFILVNNSKNLNFQQDMLPFILQSYIDKQGISGEAVAIFTDRVSIAQGKNQVFATQADLIDGKVVFFQIADENSVDKLRAQMGLAPLADYKQTLERLYGVEK